MPAPSLIVSELYLLPSDGVIAPTKDQIELVARAAKHVTETVICKGAAKKDELLSRFTAAQDRARLMSIESQSSSKEENAARKISDSTVFERAKTIAAGLKFLDPWLGVGTKAFGFGTAVVTFMLARSKLLEWIHGSGPTGISSSRLLKNT